MNSSLSESITRASDKECWRSSAAICRWHLIDWWWLFFHFDVFSSLCSVCYFFPLTSSVAYPGQVYYRTPVQGRRSVMIGMIVTVINASSLLFVVIIVPIIAPIVIVFSVCTHYLVCGSCVGYFICNIMLSILYEDVIFCVSTLFNFQLLSCMWMLC